MSFGVSFRTFFNFCRTTRVSECVCVSSWALDRFRSWVERDTKPLTHFHWPATIETQMWGTPRLTFCLWQRGDQTKVFFLPSFKLHRSDNWTPCKSEEEGETCLHPRPSGAFCRCLHVSLRGCEVRASVSMRALAPFLVWTSKPLYLPPPRWVRKSWKEGGIFRFRR